MEVTLTDTSTIVAHSYNDDFLIENYNFEQFLNTFRTTSLDLSKYWLINIGTTADGSKKYVYLIIRAYATKPFFGPHLVSLFVQGANTETAEMTTVWVHSLTFLRKELFQFHDRLSFERSTFLTPANAMGPLIRLKSIRGFIEIPQRVWELDTALPPARKQRSTEKINALLNHNIQHLIMFLNRETGESMASSIQELSNYVTQYCNELSLKFK